MIRLSTTICISTLYVTDFQKMVQRANLPFTQQVIHQISQRLLEKSNALLIYFLFLDLNQPQPENLRQDADYIVMSILNPSIQDRQMVEYRYKVYILTYLSYVGVHSLRTSYSFSKSTLGGIIQVNDAELGLVDSLMIYALSIGYLQLSIVPFSRPVLGLGVGLFMSAFFYTLVPFFVSAFQDQSYVILCILMSLSGYFQSWTWPHILMLINSEFDNKTEALKLGVWSTNTNVGNILGLTVCQYLVISNGLPWQTSMYIIGFYLFIIGILVSYSIKQLPVLDELPSEQITDGRRVSLLTEQKSQSQLGELSLIRQQSKSKKQHILSIFQSPVVVLMTVTFSLIKSIEYGIMFWLPLYFDSIGMEQYSAYIPIAFDTASIFSSIALGRAFKVINNKGLLLGPLIFILIILFAILRFLDATVVEYFFLVGGVGIFLGGCYNTFASLVTMQLVKVIEPAFRTKYLGFYTAVMMFVANVCSGTFQLVIGFKMSKNQSLIFTLFFWLGVVIVILLITVGIIEAAQEKKGNSLEQSKEIEIVHTH